MELIILGLLALASVLTTCAVIGLHIRAQRAEQRIVEEIARARAMLIAHYKAEIALLRK